VNLASFSARPVSRTVATYHEPPDGKRDWWPHNAEISCIAAKTEVMTAMGEAKIRTTLSDRSLVMQNEHQP
jgi:hypothetical protein